MAINNFLAHKITQKINKCGNFQPKKKKKNKLPFILKILRIKPKLNLELRTRVKSTKKKKTKKKGELKKSC